MDRKGDYLQIPSYDSSHPLLQQSPIACRYQQTANARQKRYYREPASRPPNLPTVVCSPLMPSKPVSPSDTGNLVASFEENGKDAFTGSFAAPDYCTQNGFDEVDNGEEERVDCDAGESHVRLPYRRHKEVAQSATGAKHVSFSTMDELTEPGRRQRSVSFIPQVRRDGRSSSGVAFSPKHLHRAARRSIVLKSTSVYIYSRSLSPLPSSDEGIDSGSYKESLEKFIHTVKPSDKVSVAPQHEYSFEKDEPDSAPDPVLSIKHSSSKCWKITSMDISSNELKSLDSLVSQGPTIAQALSFVQRLDAKQNLVSHLPRRLFEELSHLTQLVLSQNSLRVFPMEVLLCPTLAELDISSNKLEALPISLEPMPNVVKLNLSSNNLREFPEVLCGRNFPAITFLDLKCNQIAQAANVDCQLKTLEELNLSRNALTKLPARFLAGLNAVKVLDISRNKLESLPGEGADYMCNLQELKAGYNQLGVKEPEFHQFIKSALVIQLVDATNNDLTSVPPPFTWKSRGLKHLLLNNNKIASLDLADCDRFWPLLERLYIAGNRLKEIPPDIGKLRYLTCLDISYNKDIRQFPLEMGRLDCLFYMNFKGLKNLDVDSSLNARGVVSYLKAKLTKSKPCYTMKMMIVGAAGKGKTTLLSLLINEKSAISNHPNHATVGIAIKKWSYFHRPAVQYKINCWDFAGQEEFYSTHQCFLTPRSIYILVYNISRGEEELESVIPWLLNIQARAPGSPVIIVGTHRDMISDHLITSVRRDIRSRVKEYLMKPGFPSDVSFAEVSCIGAKVGLDELRNKIKEQIDSAKLRGQKIMGGAVPASYLELGDVVEKEYRRLIRANCNFRVITTQRMQEIMNGSGLTRKMEWAEVEQAVQFLHETGALLHFNDIQSNLSDLYFLDPQWLCSMMAKIITVPQMVIVKRGMLKLRDIPLLLRGPQFPTEFHPEFIRLLERFEVALRHTPDYLLIPSFLPKEKIGPIVIPPGTKIMRQYKMAIIPYGMWPRLVTRLLSFPRRAIQMTEPSRQMYWYCGVYSSWSMKAYFLIEQLEKSKHIINITVPKTVLGIRLLCSVVDNMEALIDEWFPGLRNAPLSSSDQMVKPCALCPFCSGEPYSFPMCELQSLSMTEDSIMCPQHGEVVAMVMLAPDIVIGDLDSSFHILRHQLVLNENDPATVLGKGGFGIVHKALYNGMPIAAKVFSQKQVQILGTTSNQLIRQEVSILSHLTHPNIINLVGVCMRPTPMLLMEYAELGSLSSFEPYSNLINTLKHRIALQIASALAFLHKNNIIYRDLKPGNILIFSLNLLAKINAKLSDYGISAFATEGGLTQEIGTPGYKAPELLKAKSCKMPYDEKVDIFSYGIVFFQLITNGHAPFEELSPYERDRAVEEGRPIRNTDYYGCPPWPDMQDLVLHCLQYAPNQRPSAQEVFDRLCQPEFMALNNVIPISSNWEVTSFAIRTGYTSSEEECVEVWMSSYDMKHQSMLSVINLSQKNAQPQGCMMPSNVLVLSMLAIGSSYVILGTSVGTILVYDGYQPKSCLHSLATLSDSVISLCYVKGRSEIPPPYVFAGLANGQVAVFDQCVIQTPNATPTTVLHLGRGPVKKMKRHHHQLFVITGLEVVAISLSTFEVNLRWIACTELSLRYLDCMEVGGDMVWTSAHNCTMIHLWDAEDGNLRKTVNTHNCLQSLDHSVGGENGSTRKKPNLSLQKLHRYRVKSMLLQMCTNPLLWVGLAAGYLLVIDATTCLPLMVTHRHMNSIRDIHTMRHLGQGSSASVVLTCGFGFRTRPGHEDENDGQMNNYGVLLVWDSALPRIKSLLDEIRKEQTPYR